MKKGILIVLLLSSVFVKAQSLKEALFSGKLKNNPGTVIRRGDDLSAKMDTVQNVQPIDETGKTKAPMPATDSLSKVTAVAAAPAAVSSKKDSALAMADTTTAATTTETAAVPVAKPKDNNVIWKSYMDSLNTTLKTEVLSSKKVKNGSYYVLVSYTIGTDGQVTVNDVFLSPENAFLQQQIKDRISLETPRLNPVLSDSGAPRKVNKKYNFTLNKE